MTEILIFTYLLGSVWCILNIILFFKLWGMTNDVKIIKEKLEKYDSSTKENAHQDNIQNPNNSDIAIIKPGDKVIHKTMHRIMFVDSINNNGTAALCKDENGNLLATYHLINLSKIDENEKLL